MKTTRRAGLLLAYLASVLCSPVSGFVRSPTSLSSVPSYPGASHQCNRPVYLLASSTSTSPLARSAFGGARQAQRAHKPPAVAADGRAGGASRLWMSSPAPPVKPVCSTFSRNVFRPSTSRRASLHVMYQVAAATAAACSSSTAPTQQLIRERTAISRVRCRSRSRINSRSSALEPSARYLDLSNIIDTETR